MSATPILDLEDKPPAPKGAAIGPYGYLWIFGAFFALAMLAAQAYLSELPSLNVLMFLAALYAAIAVHEAGHLIAGRLAGLAPRGVAIGGFQFFQSGDRGIFRFERQRLFSGWAMVLTELRDFQVAPFAWTVARGPMASVLLTAICALAIKGFEAGGSDWLGSLFWAS